MADEKDFKATIMPDGTLVASPDLANVLAGAGMTIGTAQCSDPFAGSGDGNSSWTRPSLLPRPLPEYRWDIHGDIVQTYGDAAERADAEDCRPSVWGQKRLSR